MTVRSQHITEEKMIDEIIQEFNFERCYLAMNTLNWEWFSTGGLVRGVPTVEMLKDAAIDRLHSAMEGVKDKENRLSANEHYSCSSGGLKGTAWKNRYGHITGIKLEFVLEEWDSDGDY
jgi:hypothetical protein